MKMTLILGLVLVFLVIVYVNDLRIRFRQISDTLGEPDDRDSKRLLNSVYRLFFLMMGVLWYFYYRLFDHLLDLMDVKMQDVTRWVTFGAMMLILAFIKFGLKRKIIHDKW